MEFWSFPPKYDNSYLPDAKSKYWFPERETMDPAKRDHLILERLKEVTAYAYEHAPFYRNHWEQAGFHPDHLKSLEDFEDKVPVIKKVDIREAQARAPLFGDYLCIDEKDIFRVHGTSGTTGRPTAFAIGRDDWDAISNAHARIMWGMGLRPGDTIFIAALFSLYLGSWGALAGAERMGATSLPFGAGAAGMTSRAVMWLRDVKPKAFYGTPSFALHLAETAKDEGIDPREFEMDVLFFSGEPGASIPGVRDRIAETYGARVIDSGSMAEMTPWMNLAGTSETDGMIAWQDVIYTEVCDPETSRRVPYGERGTPVYTHLERTSQPMIRLMSGDLTRWENGPTPCGRTYPHLPDGVFGRIDDSFTIRGENIYPSEIDSALNQIEGYGGEHRIIITRDAAMDELNIRVEAADQLSAQGEAAVDAFRQKLRDEFTRMLGIRTQVEIVSEHSIERTDFKARRVIDDREVFREFGSTLEKKS
jgi:phenylacetate-CoA ligase